MAARDNVEFAADIPPDLRGADDVLTRYGRWAITRRGMSLQQRAGHGAGRLGRPVGAVGAIAQALIAQAQQPGTVRELAARAQVSFGAAAYTCSRLRAAGQLVPVSDGRPARLRAAAALPAAPDSTPGWTQMLQRWLLITREAGRGAD